MALFRVIITLIGTLACLSAFIAFIILKNNPTAVLALFAALINAILTHLHILNWRKQMDAWYDPINLRQIGRLGFTSFAAAFSVFVYFTVCEIMTKKPIMPIESSLVLPIIWSLIASKCGLVLFVYARSYGAPPEPQLLADDPSGHEDNNQPLSDD